MMAVQDRPTFMYNVTYCSLDGSKHHKFASEKSHCNGFFIVFWISFMNDCSNNSNVWCRSRFYPCLVLMHGVL